PDGGESPEALIRSADAAMYWAQKMGRDRYEFARSDSKHRARADAPVDDLYDALEKQQFILHYQPQVDARTFQVVGFEVLLRWQHPQRGLIPPSAFVPLAEKTGVIADLDAWVLRESSRQIRAWNRSSATPLT